MNRAFLFLLFLLLAGKMCAQQVAGTLTLKEAEQRFLERNLSLIAERYNIDMAQAQVLQAKLFENPVISLEQNVYNRLNGKDFDFGKEGEAVVGYYVTGEILMCVILDPFEVPVMKVALDKGTLKDYILAANELTEDMLASLEK